MAHGNIIGVSMHTPIHVRFQPMALIVRCVLQFGHGTHADEKERARRREGERECTGRHCAHTNHTLGVLERRA